MEVTIGEIEDKLNRQIFEKPQKGLSSAYYDREKILKQYINLCSEICIHHVTIPHSEKYKVSFYKEHRIKKCLRRLADYIAYLTDQLDETKIKVFCDKQRLIHTNYDIDLPFIISNSYYGNIQADLYWISEITIYEALELSAGKFKLENLGKKLPQAYDYFIKSSLPFFKKDKLLKEFYPILKEIEVSYKSKTNRACNLLILTSIEGIVRKLGGFLIEKQNIEVSNYDNLNSLDKYLREIKWAKDFDIHRTTYRLIIGDFDFMREREPLEQIKISFKERLDFLRRRFKEDRDLILHGLEKDYGKEWNLFVNFSALNQVYETCEYYRNLYK